MDYYGLYIAQKLIRTTGGRIRKKNGLQEEAHTVPVGLCQAKQNPNKQINQITKKYQNMTEILSLKVMVDIG